MDKIIHSEVFSFFSTRATNLLFILTMEGRIVEANAYACSLTGQDLADRQFKDVIIDFSGRFDLAPLLSDQSKEHLFSIAGTSGIPQSFYFTFKQVSGYILVLGRLDTEELDSIHKEFLALNQDLNSLTRSLHKKNFELKKLNTDLKTANEKIIELTRTDPLTELANRRYFAERIEEFVSISRRKSQPLSIIMTDIDKFKYVNDTFGHDAGDQVLVGYAKLMKASVRKEDLIARFGGEEFIILLHLTDSTMAYNLAERVRKALSIQDLLEGKHFVTASFGVSQFESDNNIPDFIKRADRALYKAKNTGRNKTIIAT